MKGLWADNASLFGQLAGKPFRTVPVLRISGNPDDVRMWRTVDYHIQAEISEPADVQTSNTETRIQ